nr:hypothetical protein BaRGS_019438 [Batillaria attramentaria]
MWSDFSPIMSQGRCNRAWRADKESDRISLQQILADFPGFRRIFTDGSKSEDGRVGAAAVMDGYRENVPMLSASSKP